MKIVAKDNRLVLFGDNFKISPNSHLTPNLSLGFGLYFALY